MTSGSPPLIYRPQILIIIHKNSQLVSSSIRNAVIMFTETAAECNAGLLLKYVLLIN